MHAAGRTLDAVAPQLSSATGATHRMGCRFANGGEVETYKTVAVSPPSAAGQPEIESVSAETGTWAVGRLDRTLHPAETVRGVQVAAEE